MKIFNYFILFVSFLFSMSCDNIEPKKIALLNTQEFENKITLVRSKTIQFQLDSVTAPMIQCLQGYNSGNENYLIYLNEETGTLYINDINTKEIINKIIVKDDKPSHKKLFQGFYYHNKDSIFMFSFKPTVVLINEKGDVLREYSLMGKRTLSPNDKLPYEGFYSSTSCQGYFGKDTLYLNSIVLGGNNLVRKKVQILLNVIDGNTFLREMAFPEIYQKYNLGNADFDIYSNCINSDENRIVYSFPAYKNLIIRDITSDRTFEKPANSKFISYLYEYDKRVYKNKITNPTIEHFMTTPSFGGVYYDPYRNFYYRIALLPVKNRNINYDKKDAPIKQVSILIFDKSFNYIGEMKLEENKYEMYNAFVSEYGFNVQNKTRSDETMDFTTFLFERIGD